MQLKKPKGYDPTSEWHPTANGEKLAEAMARVKTPDALKVFCDANLEARPADGRNRYACPNCASGHRQGGTAAFHIDDTDPNHAKCFSCGWRGDVFDLAGLLNSTEDKAEQLNIVAECVGVEGWRGRGDTWRDFEDRPIDRGEALSFDGTATVTTAPQAKPTAETAEPAPAQDTEDFTEGRAWHRDYIRRMQANIEAPEAVAYLSSRGVDLETARAWGLGYDPQHYNGYRDKAGNWRNTCGRIVIPWPSAGEEGPYYHVDRAIASDVAQGKYSKPTSKPTDKTPASQCVGEQPMWNPDALKAKAFYVVEGALDALAVSACGYEAVALCTSNDSKLPDVLAGARGAGMALLMLDNDEAGQKGQEKIAGALEEKGIPYLKVDATQTGAKDAAELFARDRGALASLLGEWYTAGVESHAEAKREACRRAMALHNLYDPTDVTAGLFTMEDVLAPIPTGIARVDNALDGGLPAQGLVTLGAVSSVGKTSFVVQICVNVSATGRPVLFCSVEQGRREIAAKTLSAIMGGMTRENGTRITASAQAILNKEERERWEREDPEKVAAFTRACESYYARTHREDGTPTLYLMEPSEPPRVEEIRNAARLIQENNGQAPLIAVDYVQLLAAPAGLERGTDKQILDRNTLDLRQLARDMQTCVIVISSLNRASYSGSIDLNSFKESGMLEYSSDLLIGMQPYGLQEALAGKSEDSGTARAKAKKIMRDYKTAEKKDVELVILKNRNGGIPQNPALTFDGLTSTFSEAAPAKAGKPARL